MIESDPQTVHDLLLAQGGRAEVLTLCRATKGQIGASRMLSALAVLLERGAVSRDRAGDGRFFYEIVPGKSPARPDVVVAYVPEKRSGYQGKKRGRKSRSSAR